MNKFIPLGIALLAAVGCGSSATSKPPQPRSPKIASSIRQGAQLTQPTRWAATLTRGSSRVRFLIDGRVRHVEHNAPYVYYGDGNMLDPGTLAPGSHTFTVTATIAGRKVVAATTATVAHATPVPALFRHTWRRKIVTADVRRTASFRDPAAEDPIPTGIWKLFVGSDGVAHYIDPTPTHDETVGQVRFGPGHTLEVGNAIPNVPGVADGGFCPDPTPTGHYRWQLSDGVLVVRAIADRGCADRNSFWNGRFTR